MMLLSIDVIAQETYTFILYFVLGGLFMLFTYHFIRYINNKNNAYLYYSAYALFSFLAYCIVAKEGFIQNIVAGLNQTSTSKGFFTMVYNSVYFLFFVSFLELKKINRKQYNFIIYPIYVLLVISILSYIASETHIVKSALWFFQPLFLGGITVLTIYSFIVLINIKNPLKWYIITGGIILFITSLIGERSIRGALNIGYETGDFIFFIGLLIENMLFSVALGRKEQIGIKTRHEFQENLIKELKQNEKLRNEISKNNEEKLLLENEKIRMQQKISDLALATLRNQINPHFIYNALHSIKAYILFNNHAEAVQYLTKFSRLIRLVLNTSFEKESNLLSEVEILKLYVEIENLRFDGAINFNVTIDSALDTRDIIVPPLFLQPFIENAIWHGIASTSKKEINLNIKKLDQELKIIISDSGLGLGSFSEVNVGKNKKSYGIIIVKETLKRFYGTYNLEQYNRMDKENTQGTTIELSIPIQKKYAEKPLS